MPTFDLPDDLPDIPYGEFDGPWQERFYALMGMCFTRWAEIDHSLSDLCRVLVNTDEKNAAIIYYRTSGFDNRRNLITELIASVIPSESQAWKDINTDLRAMSGFRNLLAHHTTKRNGSTTTIFASDLKYAFGTTEDPKIDFYDVRLEVDDREIKRGKREKEKAEADDIRAHLLALTPLEDRVSAFLSHVTVTLSAQRAKL